MKQGKSDNLNVQNCHPEPNKRKEQKDPYFKAEPTLNEVLKCCYETFVNGTFAKNLRK